MTFGRYKFSQYEMTWHLAQKWYDGQRVEELETDDFKSYGIRETIKFMRNIPDLKSRYYCWVAEPHKYKHILMQMYHTIIDEFVLQVMLQNAILKEKIEQREPEVHEKLYHIHYKRDHELLREIASLMDAAAELDEYE